MPTFTKRWRSLLVGLLAFAVATGIHGVFHALGAPDRRPVPSLAALPWIVGCFGGAAMLASAVALAKRATGGLAKLGAVMLHVLIALAGLAGVAASDPAFPFGPHYEESLRLPDDRGTAYLYQGGIFCDRTVWRAGPGQWWSTRDPEAGRTTCEREGTLGWDAEQARVRVVGDDGTPLPEPPGLDGLGEGLHWAPH